MSRHSANWTNLFQDQWLLSIITEGLKIVTTRKVPLGGPVTFPSPNSQPLKLEIQKLLEKDAIEIVTNPTKGFYSRIFMVQKPDGSFRPIIDLSKLNQFVTCQKFKMNNLSLVISALQPGTWAVKIDLKDAYFHVGIHQDSRHLLRFFVDNKVYQFKALPFGLNIAPYIFSRIVDFVASYLRRQGVHIVVYLDDWLILSASKESLELQVNSLRNLLDDLGFVLNTEKCLLEPTQQFNYLGAYFNTLEGIVAPSQNNIIKTLQTLQTVLREFSAQQMLSLLGSLNFAAQFVELGRLHMRPIQMWLLARWKLSTGSLNDKLHPDPLLLSHLKWWTKKRLSSGINIFARQQNLVLQSDASLEGWGGVLGERSVKGIWSTEEKLLHINELEMLAVLNCLKALQPQIQNRSVLCQVDNSTVVCYINKQGGTKSASICLRVWELLHWAKTNNVVIKARHIAGKLNVLADRLSRRFLHTEWSLNPNVFKAILKTYQNHPPIIDLFATRWNHQLPLIYSPVYDPLALGADALSQSWENLAAYAFPPSPLIPLVLKKILAEQCVVILIAPFWPRRTWFSMILELLIELPLEIPQVRNLLRQGQLTHAKPEIFKYHAWMLSNRSDLRKGFLQKLPSTHTNASEHHLAKYTLLNGKSSLIGVIQQRLIHSRCLQLN